MMKILIRNKVAGSTGQKAFIIIFAFYFYSTNFLHAQTFRSAFDKIDYQNGQDVSLSTNVDFQLNNQEPQISQCFTTFKMKKISFLLFLIYSTSLQAQTYRKTVDGINYTFDGQGNSFDSNVDYALNNHESGFLQSYLDIFKDTKDKKYLNQFIIHAKRVQDSLNLKNSNSINIAIAPLFLIYRSSSFHSGYGWSFDSEFSWNKKGISFSTGVFISQWHTISPLYDSIHYLPLGFDPAGSSAPECYNCKFEDKITSLGLQLNLGYSFRIAHRYFIMGLDAKPGYVVEDINSILSSTNQIEMDHVKLTSTPYFIMLGKLFFGPIFKIANSMELQICPFIETYGYYPYFLGLDLSYRFNFKK